MKTKGCFITLEGGEGAGKSTQIRLLARAFAQAGIALCSTREPGGTDAAEAVRALLVTGDNDRWLPESEALLMMAARLEHVKRRIQPALAAGEWVLCDRFYDSTLVYQGIGRALGEDWLDMLYRLCLGSFAPQLTLVLDIEPHDGLTRAHSRNGEETRFEEMPIAFHDQVRAGFRALAEREPQRIILLDASADIALLHRQIIDALNARFCLALHPVSHEEDGMSGRVSAEQNAEIIIGTDS